ncbi:hypothetical protein [Desulforamulus ferrireducens]|nr:hypothetical protein [Desulforamulus ferrireducens]
MLYLFFGGALIYLTIYGRFVYKNFLSSEPKHTEFPVPTWTY